MPTGGPLHLVWVLESFLSQSLTLVNDTYVGFVSYIPFEQNLQPHLFLKEYFILKLLDFRFLLLWTFQLFATFVFAGKWKLF